MRAKDPKLAKAWSNTALLAALLADADADLAMGEPGEEEEEEPACSTTEPAFPPEPQAGCTVPLWRLTALAILRLSLAVLGPPPVKPPERAALQRLTELPRRRCT